MSKTLFEEAPLSELPVGTVSVELDNIEALALKIIVFVNYPFSKTELKNIVRETITSTPKYRTIKRGSIDTSIESLQKKNILQRLDTGFGIDPVIAIKVLPLAKNNIALLKSAAKYFDRSYSYSYTDISTRMAIMAGDFEMLDRLTKVSNEYSWYKSAEIIQKALVKTGDLTFVIPLFPQFHANHQKKLLNILPHTSSLGYFKQLREIFLDSSINPDLESKYIYVSCANLLLSIEEVKEITKALELPDYALFYTDFLNGDSELAVKKGLAFLTFLQDKLGHKRKELPGVFGLLYALVLIANGDSNNFSTAATFIRSAAKEMPKFDQFVSPFKSLADILIMFINNKTGKQITTQAEIITAYKSHFHHYFLTAVLKWFGKPLNEAQRMRFYNEKEELEYRASDVKLIGESSEYSLSRLEELQSKYNFKPIADFLQAEEMWENVLSVLQNELDKTKVSASTVAQDVKKRLIWLLDPQDKNSLICLEQTRNKSGWSTGKERSLVRLLSTPPEFATNEDKKVIACLRKHGYYNDVYVYDWNKLLKIIAVHTEIYSCYKPHLPLTIRVQQAQIKIDKNNNGAVVKLVPNSPNERVEMESPNCYIFTEWSDYALRIHSLLSDSNLKEIVIPNKGMSKAKPVFDRLGEVMPVAGNYTKGNEKNVNSNNTPVLQLTPVDDKLHVQLLIEVAKDSDALFVPGIGSDEVLINDTKNNLLRVKRNKSKEKDILLDLSERITWLQEMKSVSAQMYLDNDVDILDFLADVKEHAPQVKMIWPKGERLKVAKVIFANDINVDIKQSQDWFALDGEVVIDQNLKFTIQQLLEKTQGGKLQYIQLDDKTYVSICKDLQKRLASLNVVTHSKGKKLMVHPLGISNVEKFAENIQNLKTDKHWKEQINKLALLKDYNPTLPNNLQAELRPYQQEGVMWLDRLYNWGVGACLADDMGLGKTIQAISILLKYANNGPSLVVAPLSVCNNWVKEIVRFAPNLNPIELKSQNREELLNTLKPFDVLILSYGIIQSNPDLPQKCDWNIVVLDEAHAVKNSNTVRSKAVMKLNAKFRVITTGTPIQNHLGELWNLFQFINPGMLGSSEQFGKKFVKRDNSQDSHQMQKTLNKYISPYILRRNKRDVLDDLPEKTEITLSVSLSEHERAMYEVLRENAIEHISNSSQQSGAKHLMILSEITKLRLMSCHPKLVNAESDLPSSKLEALKDLVSDLLESKHKALIFSQFTKHLALIRQMLDSQGISYQYLDGSTPLKQRNIAIENFQNGQSDLFLISLKAGGVGLNLTAADYVIHMDPWWNPAVEDQASDRAHRIGQTRPVTIYRLIAENTIEEKIVKLHHQKRDLADKLLADTDQSAKISSDELMRLITAEEV